MSEKDPVFPIPPSHTEESSESVKPGQKFDPQSIPRFNNPLAKSQPTTQSMLSSPQATKAQKSGSMKDRLPSKLNTTSASMATQSSKQNSQTSQKKQKTREKLEKLKKHRHFSTFRFAIISFFVFLILFNSQLIYSQALYLFARSNQSNTNTPAPTEPVTPTNLPAQTAEVVGAENVIIIPKINVNAPLIFIDTTEEKAVLRALQDGVVHYNGTALPGENGNSVFFGHSSNDVWEKGNYKFVFVLLEKLAVGDIYEIHYQSRKYVYQVESTAVVAPTDLSVLNQTATPYSTLITCTPPGTSWKRFVVKAKQIAPAPTQTTQVAIQPTQTPQPANAVLPSAAPNFFEQIQIFFSSLISKLFGNQNQSNPQTPSQTDPNSNHLPEVSIR